MLFIIKEKKLLHDNKLKITIHLNYNKQTILIPLRLDSVPAFLEQRRTNTVCNHQ